MYIVIEETLQEKLSNIDNNNSCINSTTEPIADSINTVGNSTNPKDLLGISKPPIDLVPPVFEILTSLAFRDGAAKYGPFNWREKNVKWSIYYAAAKRHLASAFDGEDIDPISGVPHLAHAAACLAILMDAETTGNLVDDRPVKGASAEIIIKHTKK